MLSAGAIVSVKAVALNEPATLVARTTIFENVPFTVGVPDNTPALLSVMPVGNDPLKIEYVGAGVPLAPKV